MDIPNLAPKNTEANPQTLLATKSKIPLSLFAIVVVLALTSGFWLSRLIPAGSSSTSSDLEMTSKSDLAESTDDISTTDQLKVGVLYGNTAALFSDSAIGVVEEGGLNGEGTHTLDREGGSDQTAVLTSSTVDLDLFVGKKVEVKGQTNNSPKVSWFMDVGSIKIIE